MHVSKYLGFTGILVVISSIGGCVTPQAKCLAPSAALMQTPVSKEIAISTAMTFLYEQYGKDKIDSNGPYTAVFTKGIWVVKGTVPETHIGGSYVAKIDGSTGCILAGYPER